MMMVSVQLIIFLLENTTDGKLKSAAVKKAAERFGITVKIVSRIRSKATSCADLSKMPSSLRKSYKGNSGRPKYDIKVIHSKSEGMSYEIKRYFSVVEL